MFVVKHSLTLTTDGSGDASGYIGPCNGRVLQIVVVPDGTSPPANNYTVEVYQPDDQNGGSPMFSWTESSGATSRVFLPRLGIVDSSMAAALYAADGEPVLDTYVLADEQILVVVGSGGDTKTVTLYVYTG